MDRRDALALDALGFGLLGGAGSVPGIAHAQQTVFLGLGDGDQRLLFGDHSLGELGCVVAGGLADLLDVGAGTHQHHRGGVAFLAAGAVLDLDDVGRLLDQLSQFGAGLVGAQGQRGAGHDGEGGFRGAHGLPFRG